jgi:hypothetical protein
MIHIRRCIVSYIELTLKQQAEPGGRHGLLWRITWAGGEKISGVSLKQAAYE